MVNEYSDASANKYINEVYQGYLYLLLEGYETLGHQTWDLFQDILIKTASEKFVQYGHPAELVNFEVNVGIHKLIHDIAGSKFAHGLQGFLTEVIVHAGIKIVATAIFPFIHPLKLSSNIPDKIKDTVIHPFVKFMGMNPLEIINFFKTIPNELLGSDNVFTNTVDKLILHKDHYYHRAENPKYHQFMEDYTIFMESVDALVHMFDDISVLYNNRHLDGITKKAYYWFQIKYRLYLNTEIADRYHNNKVHHLRGSSEEDETCLNEYNDNFKELIYSFSCQVFSFILPQLVNKLYNYYFYGNVPEVSQALVGKLTEQSLIGTVRDSAARLIAGEITKTIGSSESKFPFGSNSELSNLDEGDSLRPSPATKNDYKKGYYDLRGSDNKEPVYCLDISSFLPAKYGKHVCNTPDHLKSLESDLKESFSPIDEAKGSRPDGKNPALFFPKFSSIDNPNSRLIDSEGSDSPFTTSETAAVLSDDEALAGRDSLFSNTDEKI